MKFIHVFDHDRLTIQRRAKQTNIPTNMSILRISATKSAPDSKLGITYVVNNSAMILTHISDSSIFAAGDLQVGHKIVSINGNAVSGVSKDEVKMILESLGKEVIFDVKNSWSSTFLLKNERNYSRTTVPSFLEIAGVPLSKWKHICDLLENELKPVVAKYLEMNRIYNREMEDYTEVRQLGWGMTRRDSMHFRLHSQQNNSRLFIHMHRNKLKRDSLGSARRATTRRRCFRWFSRSLL